MNHRHLFTNLRYHRLAIAAFGMLACLVAAGLLLITGFVTGMIDWLMNDSLDLPSAFLWALLPIFVMLALMIGFKGAIDFDRKANRAMFRMGDGRHAEAETALRGLLADNAAPATDDPRRGDLLQQLTYLARVQGNYDDAELFGQQWLSGAERAWGSDHWRVINALQELAATYIEIARYSQAMPLLERALRILNVKPTTDRVALMRCLGLMRRMYLETRHYDRAQAFSQRAFEVFSRERVWREFPDVAFDFVASLVSAGNIEAAETILRTGHDSVRKTFPAESSERAELLGVLGQLGFAQKRYAEAEQLAREAVAIWEKRWPDHPNNSASWQNLGITLTAQKKFVEAEECYKKALRLCEDFKAPEHPHLATILEHYADLLQKLGRTAEAFELNHRAAHIHEFQVKNPID